MKKMASLFTLLVFLGTSFLTPVSYAQTTEMGISNVSINEELQNEELTDEIETFNTVGENPEDPTQFTLETSDDPSSLQMENRDLDVALQDSPQRSGTMFIPGDEFNLRLKSLANDRNYYDTWDYDENIIKFKKSDTPAPVGATTTGLAIDDTEYEIIAWYDNGTIYYYTEADKIYLNPDSSNMFDDMLNLTSVDTAERNTSNVESMYSMFAGCNSLTELDVSNWDTSNVRNMNRMFAANLALKNLDVSSWNTSRVVNMGGMFLGCVSLTELDVSNWDTSNVVDMYEMFIGNLALKILDVSNWNTSKVRNMNRMFGECINLRELNLKNWDTSEVTDMRQMFYQCDNLETIYTSDKFVTTNIYNGYNMFGGAYSLIGGNGTIFDPNYIDYDYANIDTDQTPGYFTNISGNTVIVRFFTNGGLEVDPQVVSKGGTIESVTSTKANATFRGWYTDEGLTKSFNTSTAVNSNLKLYAKWECKSGYYDNKGQCIDENKKIEQKGGIIKITDGEKTIYIKDRNQGATESRGSTLIHKLLNPVLQKVKERQTLPLGWLYNYVANELSNIAGSEMFTVGELMDHYNNDAIKLLKDIKSKYEAGKYTNSYGNYYYWGNDIGVSYSELGLGDLTGSINPINGDAPDGANNILIENLTNLFAANVPESAIERGFSGGKIGVEGEGWIEGNSNPCDASKGEYLPTLQDWVDLMQVWGNINGHRVVRTELGEGSGEVYVFGSGLDDLINGTLNPMELLELLNLEMTDDLMIPGAGGVIKAEDVVSLVKVILMIQGIDEDMINSITDYVIDDLGVKYVYLPLLSPLRVASESGDTVGIYIGEAGIISVTNDIGEYANSLAAPVRCFVDESAWPKDEEKKENNYSGGGGRGGSSSKSDTEADTHGAADDQKDTDKDKKTEEKQENTQNENKSETPTPQNNQGNKGSNSASNEVQQAYNFVHSYGITNKTSVENAKMDNTLTRIQMAKMLSQYAINVLGKEPDVSKGVIRFSDVTNKMNKDYDNGVNLAYQLGIMGQNMKDNKFRPNDEVSRAELVTALSRLLYSTSDGEYKSTGKYYVNHMEKLKKEGIITKDNPKMKEKRGYIMLMLMRSVK